MELTPIVAVHMGAALAAIATGPVALWARLGARRRPRLHRAFGYAWVTLMLVAALSAMFIRDTRLPHVAGYTPIHLLVPLTLGGLLGAFWLLARGNVRGHALTMKLLYFFACIVAGAFTLLPNRYLGGLVWSQFGGLATIVRHTPPWAWLLLAALLLLGWRQSRDRTASLAGVSTLPLAATLLSLWGTVSAFGHSPLLAPVLAAWLLAAGIAATTLAQRPPLAWYDRATRSFDLAGSWAPMALLLAAFLARYAVSARLALDPASASDAGFALAAAAVYGAIAGIFLGRAARLWRLAFGPGVPAAA